MIKLIFFTTLVVTFVAGEYFLSQEYIDQINREATTWIAGKNFEEETSLESIKGRLGSMIEKNPKVQLAINDESDDDYPKSFDARDKWGDMCPSIKQVRDQSACASAWAFGAVQAITDRTCIATNGTFQKTLSVTDLISCCDTCGNGCGGGLPEQAWRYWIDFGLSSGGDSGDLTSCKPYPFSKCKHRGNEGKYPACPEAGYLTPDCVKECQASYPIPYAKDISKGSVYFPLDRSEIQFKEELMKHGPFEVSFSVYSDWIHYKSGVYHPTHSSEYIGGHSGKIVGWGVENRLKYWTIVNSWNEDWGMNGTFKIVRGMDICGIESHGFAGYLDE